MCEKPALSACGCRSHVAADAISRHLLPILDLPGISLLGKAILRETFRLFLETPLSIVDTYYAALMADLGLTEIYSFDPHFDGGPGITRLEP